MLFTPLDLAGAYLIEVEPHRDERGFFARTYCAREFTERGLETSIVQESISFNQRRGTVRGMHFQAAPHAETKTVRCTAGSIYDVLVDLRGNSPTYGEWRAIELSEENRRTLYIPAGFAHGFQTLVDESELLYQMSVAFVPSSARGIRWDDETLAIKWPIREGVTISSKDLELPELRAIRAEHGA
jgi:dTDP-4-dehydrorhamnose 3,5-epimerase